MENNLSPEKEFPAGKKNSPREKLSTGKLAGIIFCTAAAVCTVILLFVSGYFSGQMKTIDKYWTSVARGDLNGYKSCFLPEFAEKLTEADLEADAELLQALLRSEEVKTSVTFVNREEWTPTLYRVYYDITIYNDDDHVTEHAEMFLHREGMKWVYATE